MGISLENVTAFYDGNEVLSNINLSILDKGITAIIGPSGCGKSTLLLSMNGQLKRISNGNMSGKIFLNGVDTSHLSKEELSRRVGLVSQTPAPFPFSIYKNMTYAPKYMGIRDKCTLEEIVVSKLKMAGLYDEVKDELKKSALKLSGGQKQRLCIARALTVEPDILLLDEPCSALDINASRVIEDLLMELKKKYIIVLVTHNINQAKRIADRVAFLCNGRLVEGGEKEEFFSNPKEEETKKFLSGFYG